MNALYALEATLRHGSFSAAAGELGITSAAVGQRVRSLEDYLAEPLFERTPTGIRALAKAQQVGELLSDSFSGLAVALDQLKARGRDNSLSVTLPASFVENWLSPMISEFYQRHTAVDLRLHASNRDVDLLTETFDFAVRYGAHPADHLKEIELFGDFVLPVCSPGLANNHKINPEMKSLKNIPLIHIPKRTGDLSWVDFEGWGQAFGFDSTHMGHGVQFSKVSSGIQSAITGQGLVLCGLVEAFSAVRSGQLVAPFGLSMHCETEFKYRLLWVRDRKMTPIQMDFKKWLLEKTAQFKLEMEARIQNASN